MLWFPFEFLGAFSAPVSQSGARAGGLAGGRAWPRWPWFGRSLSPAQSQGACSGDAAWSALIAMAKEENVALGHCRVAGRVIKLNTNCL